MTDSDIVIIVRELELKFDATQVEIDDTRFLSCLPVAPFAMEATIIITIIIIMLLLLLLLIIIMIEHLFQANFKDLIGLHPFCNLYDQTRDRYENCCISQNWMP